MNFLDKRLFFCLTFFIVLSTNAQKTYNNPILSGFYPDPSICRVGEEYYIVNSTFAYFPGLPIFHSKDLVNWQLIGYAMDRPSQLNTIGDNISQGLYAPAISFNNGLYYIVCTHVGKGGNFVITAKNPAGPWSEPTYLKEVSGIDPSLFFDDNNKSFIVYNSDPPNKVALWNGHRSIRMREFDYKNLKTIGEEIILVNGGSDTSKHPVWIEGPHLYKINSWYYLMCAEGGTGDKHSEVIFRAKKIYDKFEPNANNPILTQRNLNPKRDFPITATGHADLVNTPDGKWYSVFLGCRPYQNNHSNIGRETFLAPVRWTNDGWPIITSDSELVKYAYPLPFPKLGKPASSLFSGNFSYKVDFNDTLLDARAVFLRTITKKWYSINSKSGVLLLQLQPYTLGGSRNPSFIGFRQQHHNCTAIIALDFLPKADNEKAGLTIFQSEQNFYFLCKSSERGTPVIQLYKSNKSYEEMELVASKTITTNNDKLFLRIAQNGSLYNCEFSSDNKKWQRIGTVNATFLSTKTAGGFVGSIIGMYATSLGQPSTTVANYDWFSYSGKDEF